MTNNQEIIEKLKKLLTHKKSKWYYSMVLGVSIEEINLMLEEIRKGEKLVKEEDGKQEYIKVLQDTILKFEEDVKSGKAEASYRFNDEIRTLDELIEKGKIDVSVWNIDKYVQNYWGNIKDPHWQVKAFLSKKTDKENFQKNFIEFLSTYQPVSPQIEGFNLGYPPSILIINKQDEHLNKFDVYGDNDIKERFLKAISKTRVILKQSVLSNHLDKIVYVIGSDQLNSEWTKTTTKGTPQENILTYHESFTKICNYEVQMIAMLKSYCTSVEVIFVSGNHDEYAGWHIINWLKTYFRENPDIIFDDSPRYRKYHKYGISGVMFNHGDAIKPAKLANIFPIEFREEWSSCKSYYIFTGDKHHEVSLDFGGIKFYQLPALSTAKSLWDDKSGHVCDKAEITGFLIEKENGLTNILKQPL